jgi:mRNA interferase YafO
MPAATRVEITDELQTSLERQDIVPGVFVSAFADWKADWPKREYSSALFGKDGAYVSPDVDGMRYQLRHVHLVPLVDRVARSQWETALRRLGKKTSNRVLVYVANGKGAFLLVYILDEPDAHDIAKMKTKAHKEIMLGFAEVAAAFLEDGSIIR